MFGGNGRFGRHSERDLPAVFTPPRDDPATRPRFARSPRELDDWGPDHPTRYATRQACAISVAVILGFAIISISVYGMYEVASAVLGKQKFVDCEEQPVQNGIIRAAPLNTTAAIQCDKGYALEQAPDAQVKCQLVWKKCVVYKRATEIVPKVEECEWKYLYTPGMDPVEVLESSNDQPREVEDHENRLKLATYEMTRGMCVLESMVATAAAQRLYRQRRGGPVPSAVGVTGAAAPTWSTEASAACLLVLAFVSIGAVAVSAVSRAQGSGTLSGSRRRVANEPDVAPLLDDPEERAGLFAAGTDDDR